MTTVKVNDRVQYSVTAGPGADYNFAGLKGTVLAVTDYIVLVQWDNGGHYSHSPRYILPLVEPVDDPMPPVPESTMYAKAGDRILTLNKCWDRVLMRIQLAGEALGYGLDPDTALGVAHDLTRMAMEIKRQQKAAEQM